MFLIVLKKRNLPMFYTSARFSLVKKNQSKFDFKLNKHSKAYGIKKLLFRAIGVTDRTIICHTYIVVSAIIIRLFIHKHTRYRNTPAFLGRCISDEHLFVAVILVLLLYIALGVQQDDGINGIRRNCLLLFTTGKNEKPGKQ